MSTAVNINCPVLGSFDANGTAKMEVAIMQVVSLDDPHETFNVSADPFTHFTLAEEASGASILGYTVSVNATTLKEALGGWLKGGATDSASQSVEDYMIEYLRGEINALIGGDGVGAALQASVVKDLAFAQYNTDAQDGADALVDELADDQSAKNSIGLQFPAARYPETFASTLPAQSGDSLTFQFTISSSITVSDDQIDPATSNDDATIGNPSAAAALSVVNKSRIVHIVATKA
jgi:hypothetical protein